MDETSTRFSCPLLQFIHFLMLKKGKSRWKFVVLPPGGTNVNNCIPQLLSMRYKDKSGVLPMVKKE